MKYSTTRLDSEQVLFPGLPSSSFAVAALFLTFNEYSESFDVASQILAIRVTGMTTDTCGFLQAWEEGKSEWKT